LVVSFIFGVVFSVIFGLLKDLAVNVLVGRENERATGARGAENERPPEKDMPLRASAGAASNTAIAMTAAIEADAMLMVFICVAPVCHPVWLVPVLGARAPECCSARNMGMALFA
jgi:hypothetical protein